MHAALGRVSRNPGVIRGPVALSAHKRVLGVVVHFSGVGDRNISYLVVVQLSLIAEVREARVGASVLGSKQCVLPNRREEKAS